MIEVQCTSCHTRYRIDEQVLPDGLPTFKCSRCGHVFSFEPRKSRPERHNEVPDAAAGGESASGSPGRAQQAVPTAARSHRNESPSENALTGTASIVSSGAGPEAFAASAHPPQETASTTNGQLPPPDPEQVPLRGEGRLAGQFTTSESLSPQQSTSPQAAQSSSKLFTDEDGNAASGESRSFDFADEQPAPDRARYLNRGRRQRPESQQALDDGRWEVGEDEATPQAEVPAANSSATEEPPARRRRKVRADDLEDPFTDDAGLVDETEAPVYNRAMTHSAGFFLMLIFLIGAGFAALALLIRHVPGSSAAVLSYLPMVGERFVAPTTPAKLVALRDVSALYQPNKQGQRTLVISGSAENVGTSSLSIVQLTAALRDGQRRLMASQAVYCGNNVSAGMISQMTPHEIEFFQRLEPAKSFILEPSASCRFVAVFLNPPAASHTYDVSVSQAIAETAPAADEPAS